MDYKLLPHTEEKIFGFNRNCGQLIGWEISKFNIQQYWDQTSLDNVIVGVLDTGCDTKHEDLRDNILPGYNTFTKNSNVEDDNGHGTHVAGTIAATNNGLGMVGVAPRSKIIPIKVLNGAGSGSETNIADGIRWAVDNGCNILTMSLASKNSSKIIEKAIDYAQQNNVLVVCAAGNGGNNSSIMYPARLDYAVAVGAIDKNLNICNFSCMGQELDFLSPGDQIFSCAPNNNYKLMSGTSMATPFAVGCISLTLSNKKNIPVLDIINSMKERSIKSQNYPHSQGIIQPMV